MSKYIPNTNTPRQSIPWPKARQSEKPVLKQAAKSAPTTKAFSRKRSDILMWPFSELSLSAASRLGDLANIGLIASLVLGVVSTFVVVKTTDVKEHFWERARERSNERISELSTQGDQLRKDTAEANARAVEAKLALERYKSPRTLTPGQQTDLTTQLNRFSGATFDIAIGPMGDPEPLYLARSIFSALSSAGWRQVAWADRGMSYTEAPMLGIGVTSVTNVIVDVHPDYWEKLGAAANALAKGLAASGIDAISDSKPTSRKTDAIHIRIGRKL